MTKNKLTDISYRGDFGMENFNGIGANFVGRKNLYGIKKAAANQTQKTAGQTQQNTTELDYRQSNPDEVLNSMHSLGLQNRINPKIGTVKNDPQMNKRIGDFMANFEEEITKGLQVISKDFPTLDEKTAAALAAKAVLKASDL